MIKIGYLKEMKKIITLLLCTMIGTMPLAFCEEQTLKEIQTSFDETFVTFSERSYITTYLSNGKILFTQKKTNDKGIKVVDSIVCIDQYGKNLWTLPLPNNLPLGRMYMKQWSNGEIAFLAQDEEGFFQLMILSEMGLIKKIEKLPKDIKSPALFKDAFAYLCDYGENEFITMGVVFQNGKTISFPVQGISSASIYETQSVEDQNQMLVLCGEGDNQSWELWGFHTDDPAESFQRIYHIGNLNQHTIGTWIPNQYGAITLQTQDLEGGQETISISCFDRTNNQKWHAIFKKKNVLFPTVSIIKELENGNVKLWGNYRNENNQAGLFTLILDDKGSIVAEEYKKVLGDCVIYLNQEIYVVLYNDQYQAYALKPFSEI